MGLISRIRKYLIWSRSWVRVLLLCVALAGSFFVLFTALLPLNNVVHATSRHNMAPMGTQKVMLSRDGGQIPTALPAGQNSAVYTHHTENNAARVAAKTHNNTVTVVPAAKNMLRPHGVTRSALTPPPILGPDLSINVASNASIYNLGDTVTFTLTVRENPLAITPIASGVPILLMDSLPLGLTAVVATTTPASSWSISTTGTTSPVLLTATYTGLYPIAPGATLPALTLTGTAVSQGSGPFADTAAVTALGDVNLPNETSTANVTIAPAVALTPTIVPTAITVVAATPTATALPTAIATMKPTMTVIPTSIVAPIVDSTSTPTVTPIGRVSSPSPEAGPSFALTKTNAGGDSFTVGQRVVYTLSVRDLPGAGPERTPNSVTVTDVMPAGLQQISATAANWNISVNSSTSPTVVLATYVGTYPIAPGQVLSPVSVSGVLTSAAVPTYTNTAVATSPDDPGQSNTNQATDTITVSAVTGTAIPTGTPTLTPAATPTVSAVGTLTPTATVTVLPSGTSTSTVNATAIIPVGQESIFPDLSITQTHLGSGPFTMGQQLTSVLTVSDLPAAGPVLDVNSLTVLDVVSVGEQNLVASGTGWSFTLSDQSSPAVITATYVGAYPIVGGTTLPPITITSTLTADAVTGVTATARVSAPGNAGTHSLASDTTFVLSQTQSPDHNNHHEHNNNGHGNSNNGNNTNENINNSSNNNQHNGNSNNGGSSSNYPALPLTGSDPTP